MVEPTQPTLPDLDQYIVDISVDPYSDYSVAVKWIIPKALDNFTNYFEYQIFCWQSSGDGKAIFQKDNVTKIPVNITGMIYSSLYPDINLILNFNLTTYTYIPH